MTITLAKIRLVADIFDVDHYGAKYEHGFVEIPGQSLVGANCILLEVATEIETIYRAETCCWSEEHYRHLKTIEELNARIKELEGRATHAN